MNSWQKKACDDYLKEFNRLSGVKVSENKELLTEQLVTAKWDDLKIAMQQDRELNVFLNTPAKNLPDNYKYLVREIDSSIENETLLTIIKMSFSNFGRGTIFPLFSKSGSKITGFAAYILNGREVTAIKMFSLNPQGVAPVLIRDLTGLLDTLIAQYDKVSWDAMRDNPANKIYQSAIKKYGGTATENGDEVHYSIPGNPQNSLR
jgi:hypothetical protein